MSSSNPNPEVVTAEVVMVADLADVKQPKSRIFSCFVIFLVASLVIGGLLVGGGIMIWRSLAPPEIIEQTETEYQEELKNDFAKSKKAFASPYQQTDSAEFDQISRLVSNVGNVLDGTTNARLQNFVDMDLYVREIRKHSELGSLAYLGNSYLKTYMSDLLGPIPFSEFQIYDIESINETERIVTLQTTGEYGEIARRWWIAKDKNNRWKLFDWQPLDYANRNSKERAILAGEMNERYVRDYERYCVILTELDSATDYGAELSEQDIQRRLRECQSLQNHPAIMTTMFLDAAEYSHIFDENELALELLQQVPNAENVPGVYRRQAAIYFEDEEYKKAIAAAESYEELIGFSFEISDIKAKCFKALDEKDNERDARLAALPYMLDFSGYTTNLIDIVTLLKTPKQFDDLLIKIESLPKADLLFSSLVSNIESNVYFKPELQQLVAHLSDKRPGSEAYLNAASSLDFFNGDYKNGLKHLKSAFDKQDTNDEDNRYYYWSTAVQHGQAKQSFAELKPSELLEAFQTIAEIYFERDYDFSGEDFKRIITEFQQHSPKDPIAYQFLGELAFEANDFESAVVHLENARTDPEVLKAKGLWESNTYHLLLSLHRLGNNPKVLELAGDTPPLHFMNRLLLEENFEVAETLIGRLKDKTAGKRLFQAVLGGRKSQNSSEIKAAIGEIATLLKEHEKNNRTDQGLAANDPFFSPRTARTELIRLCRKQGNLVDAFAAAPSELLFDTISRTLLEQRNWEQCLELIKIASQRVSERDPAFHDQHRINKFLDDYNFRREIYGKFVLSFHASRYKMPSDDDGGPMPESETAVRAALRVKRVPLARQLAENETATRGNPRLECLVALYDKDFKKFQRLQDQLPDYQQGFYDDPDLPKLKDSELEKIAPIQPRGFGYQYGTGDRVVLLTPAPIEFDRDKIKKIFKTVFGSNDFKITKTLNESGGSSWLITSNRHRVVLSTSDKPMKFEPLSKSQKQLSEAINKHKSLVSIRCQAKFRLDDRQLEYATKMANEIIAQGNDVLALGINDFWTADQFSAKLNQISSYELIESDLSDSMTEVYEFIEPTFAENQKSDLEFESEFAKSIRAFKQADPSSRTLQLTVKVTSGLAVEYATVNITEVEVLSYGPACRGRLMSSPALAADFRQGNLVDVFPYSIDQWKMEVNGQISAGRRGKPNESN